MNILILQPTSPSHPPALRQVAADQLTALLTNNPAISLDVAIDGSVVPASPHPSKYARHAAVRNHMLDTYLKPHHDYVLWIDSDLVEYPADLATKLLQAARTVSPDCDVIAAPLALLDKAGNRFYDIGGFIEHGQRFRIVPPYCTQDGPIWELDSVGCCYLAPAWLYRDGVRYSPPETDYYVEHWSVMQQAQARGVQIVAVRDLVVKHAWLPMFGLPLN